MFDSTVCNLTIYYALLGCLLRRGGGGNGDGDDCGDEAFAPHFPHPLLPHAPTASSTGQSTAVNTEEFVRGFGTVLVRVLSTLMHAVLHVKLVVGVGRSSRDPYGPALACILEVEWGR